MFDKMASEDFEWARLKAFWRKAANWLTGKRNDLLAYDEIRARLPLRGQHDLGIRQVPIERIIGSVGRYRDFDRAFLPLQSRTRDRWVNIDKAHYEDIILPPVDLLKIGEIYFVRDGNHRVSVARERGQSFVDAYVTEIDVPGPVHSEADLDGLVILHERQEFAAATGIDHLIPDHRLDTNLLGQYPILLEHIAAHQWYMGERQGASASLDDAVLSWYKTVYLPVVDLIDSQELLRSFPRNTPTDLYLWIMAYWWRFRQSLQAGPGGLDRQSIQELLAGQPEQPARKLLTILLHTDLIDELAARLDYARFMQSTGLGADPAGASLRTTIPGGYDLLLEHIAAHRWFLGERQNAEVPYPEAVRSWYETVYLPLVEIIREQEILSLFPDRKETDLYLWIIQRHWAMRQDRGGEVPFEAAVEDFADEHTPPTIRQLRSLKTDEEE
jgi:hypothetical protein